MKFKKAVELSERYANCAECGNENVGNGQGTVRIEGNMFRRTCKCGWKVEVTVEEGDNQ
ncbi:DUF3797 domain-containing protein [Paenibacillus wynnii]|uniref:DUF3797 domain-containing protein n=1 Tax=Paenibacillus wynnii TaxID=268407 RepID=UPI0009FBAB80|nr:DUF3797 domain-containing protein [Paenibacillus wynnii]